MPDAAPTLETGTVHLGRAIRARRKTLGVSMTTAAEAAGMSRATWHRLEKGEPTVATGLLLAAAEVLGLELELSGGDAPFRAQLTGEHALPLQIRLDDYPQLRSLAWQVRNGDLILAPHEALGLYERNWRHLDREALGPGERALIKALRTAFGSTALDV